METIPIGDVSQRPFVAIASFGARIEEIVKHMRAAFSCGAMGRAPYTFLGRGEGDRNFWEGGELSFSTAEVLTILFFFLVEMIK